MKQVKVIINNNVAQVARFETDESMQGWLQMLATTYAWGKPAGEYKLSELSQDELAQEISRRETDDFGNNLLELMITIPAQYSIEITDVTAQLEQEKVNNEALAYLMSTDWYAIREAETGVPMPTDIKNARAAARASIVK